MKPTMLLLVVVASPCFVLTPLTVAAQQVLSGHVPEPVARFHLQPIGHLPGTNRLPLAIGLPLRNRETLTNLLGQLYDSASSNYHHYLTSDQVTEKFGPTEQDYQAVITSARSQGFQTTGTHPNRALLDVSAWVAEIEKALHVKMNLDQH